MEYINDNNLINNIKNKYILRQIGDYIKEKKLLEIIKYNKKIQEKLDIRINDYKKYYNQIEIEVIPTYPKYTTEDKYKFINIVEGQSYYHIYLNDDEKNEIKRN